MIPPNTTTGDFGDLTAIRRYAEEVSAVDDGVGAVLDKLKALRVDQNTLVVFAADQGWAGGQHGIWGMGDHTRPVNALEHSMRVRSFSANPVASRRTGWNRGWSATTTFSPRCWTCWTWRNNGRSGSAHRDGVMPGH
ncbi:MAG: sulfatase-like hydrolase/transferase [Verrucomicrobiales bacterium]